MGSHDAGDRRSEQVDENLMKIRFQNYNPRTEKLKKCELRISTSTTTAAILQKGAYTTISD